MNPWLEWHHFDPPRRVEPHHRPEGLIGLCAEHHRAADGGAYSIEELRDWKRRGRGDKDVVGFFEWMRADLHVVMGTCVFVGATVALEIQGEPAIWLAQSPDGPLVLNLRMPTVSDEPRLGVYNNWYVADETPPGMTLRCPPIGHGKIEVEYASGDKLGIEFSEVETSDDWDPDFDPPGPVTAVTINLHIPAADIEIDHRGIRLGSGLGRDLIFQMPVGLAFG